MNKVLFGQSYYLRYDAERWKERKPYPPLGTLYAAAYVRDCGYEVRLFDATLATSENDWALALAKAQPQFAVIYEDHFNERTKMHLPRMRESAYIMIQMARMQGCTVIVSSADANSHPEEYLTQGAHFVLIGEGEQTVGELLERLTEHTTTNLAQIPGLAFRPYQLDHLEEDPQGAIHDSQLIRTAPRPNLTKLDSLPYPAWELVDVPQYQQIWQVAHNYSSLNLATTRGCSYSCNWCAKPIWGQEAHSRSPAHVVTELRALKETYEIDHICFVDQVMGLSPNWLQQFADLVETEGELVPFTCTSRADILAQAGAIETLHRAGCQMVWLGIESGSQRLLDAMGRGIEVEEVRKVFHLLRKYNIQVGFFLQFGYPGETQEDIEKSFQLIRDCCPDELQISISTPLPNTPLYDAIKEKQREEGRDVTAHYQGNFGNAYYQKLRTVLYKEYQLLLAKQRGQQNQEPVVKQMATRTYYRATLPFDRMQLKRLVNGSK